MASKTYVTEVQNVIELGYIDETTVLEMYQVIAKQFAGRALEIEETREALYAERKHNLPEWHERIDCIVKQYDERLNWRDVKVVPSRFKICPMPGCYRWFYDVARNGKTITCNYEEFKEWDFTNREMKHRHDEYGNRLSVCAVNLDKFRRAAVGKYTDEDLLWPRSRRKVQETSVDLQPSDDDAQGHAILNEMQKS